PRQQTKCLLAVEDRKLSDALRKPCRLIVVRDCFLRLGDGDILPLHEVRANPARDCLPVGFLRVCAETKPGTEKGFVAAARSMQIFDQPEKASTVEAIQPGLHVAPGRFSVFGAGHPRTPRFASNTPRASPWHRGPPSHMLGRTRFRVT